MYLTKRFTAQVYTMENPATAFWSLNISDGDFAKLKRGVRARDMDDRWVFKNMTDKELEDEAMANKAKADRLTTDETLIDEVSTDEPTTDNELTYEELMAETPPNAVTGNLDQGSNISIRRSWTNKGLYRFLLNPSENGNNAKIEAITWEQNYGNCMSEEQAKINIVILCRHICKCDIAAAPDYDTSLYSG